MRETTRRTNRRSETEALVQQNDNKFYDMALGFGSCDDARQEDRPRRRLIRSVRSLSRRSKVQRRVWMSTRSCAVSSTKTMVGYVAASSCFRAFRYGRNGGIKFQTPPLRRHLNFSQLNRAAGKVKMLMRGRSSVVERQLPKLYVEGSIPFARSRPDASLALWLIRLSSFSHDLLAARRLRSAVP
jgi:hypothetical protein